MTTIDKLGVLGVRSFGPDGLQVLSFEKPVTLIVGHNGAGKTTIVECLKMACTGELPPNSNKGQNFIHDPKVANAAEVKGQIRLMFTTVTGKKVCASRNFQLTNTKDKHGRIKANFKALESVLQTRLPNGETTSISHKCADMDAQLPRFLGVPKAVLENVIFCHQEDGNWPLAEMSKLKKKFDDLFGATRYTKALEAINAVRKEKAKQVKEHQRDVDVLRQQVDRANDLRRKVALCKKKEETFEESLKHKNQMTQSLEGELNDAIEAYNSVRQFETDFRVKKELLDSKQAEVVALKESVLEEYVESEEELKRCGIELEAQIASNENALKVLESEVCSLEERARVVSVEKDALQAQAKSAYLAEERIVAARQKKEEIRLRLCKAFGSTFAEGADALAEHGAIEFSDLGIRQLLTHRRDEHREQQRDAKQRAEKVQSLEQKLGKQEKELRDKVTLAMASRRNLLAEVEELKKSVSVVQRLKNDRAAAEESLATKKRLLERTKSESHEQSLAEQTSTLRRERDKLTREMEELQKASEVLQRLSTISQRVESDAKALQEAKSEVKMKLSASGTAWHAVCAGNTGANQGVNLEQLCTKVNKGVRDALDGIGSEEFCREELQKVVDVLSAEALRCETVLRKSREVSENSTRAMGAKEGESRMLQGQVAELKQELGQAQSRLAEFEVSSASEFVSLREKTQQVLEKAVEDGAMAKGASRWLENFRTYSLQRKKCAFCLREFKEEQEIQAMNEHVDTRVAKLPVQRQKQESIVAEAKAKLAAMEPCGSSVTSSASLEQRLAAQNAKYNELAEELDNLAIVADEARAEADKERNQLKSLVELGNEMKALQECVARMLAKGRSLESARSQLSEASGSQPAVEKQSLSDCFQSLKLKREQLAEVDRHLRQKEAQQSNLQAERLKASNDVEAEENRLLLLEERVSESESAIEKLRQKEQELSDFADRTPTLNSELQMVSSQLESAKTEMRRVHQEGFALVEKQKSEVNEAEKALGDLKSANSTLADATAAMGGASEISKSLKDAQAREQKFAEEINAKKTLLAGKRDEIAETQKWLTQLEKNLRLKHAQAACNALREELRKMKAEVGGKDPSAMANDLEKKRIAVGDSKNAAARLEGERRGNLEWLQQCQRDLAAPKFRVVDDDYQAAVEALEVAALTVEDLKDYYSALDRAVMNYHSIKMREVNRSLRELWQATYKGTDIDYIAIRSDTEEDQENAMTSVGQRSYNYRVVMAKEEVELDMRGRCSAGQKVLACIVIRLVLAEAFSFSCGVLTLDEPTTNLDRRNIEGLAESLSELIELRKHHLNFQLIMITHDEEFVRRLARHRHCDHFFKVSKNSKGYSVVTKADIRCY